MDSNMSIIEQSKYYLNPRNVGINNSLNYNNKVWVCGTIENELQYDHECAWEKFYGTIVKVYRLSGNVDHVPVIISEHYLTKGPSALSVGMHVELGGQLRSHNYKGKDDRFHLGIFLFVTAINVFENEDDDEFEDANLIYLDGNLCKQPIYRITPFGREITDIMLAVNRAHGKSDYIPCIVWGRTARFASTLNIGDRIKVYGRVQSREYFKRNAPDSEIGETRITYEVSILRLKKEETIT